MKPITTDDTNAELAPPPGLANCDALPVTRGKLASGPDFIDSVWELTAEELAQIQHTGRVYLTVIGHYHPPVALSVTRPDYQPAGDPPCQS